VTVSIPALITANARRFAVARLLTAKGAAFRATARRLVAAKDRYLRVAGKTGVPWWVIAVIHQREASQRWDASIAQGDPWDHVSSHVPKGRGPFASWDEAAFDALMNCAPYAARWKDWSAGGAMTLLEQYNGLGYAHMDRPSPYIWAGTDQYARGKYVADGVFDPSVVDGQLGCAGMLLAMAEIDASVAQGLGKPLASVPTLPPQPVPQPPRIQSPHPPAWIAAILSIVARLFGK
jgi:lysozyme family protein